MFYPSDLTFLTQRGEALRILTKDGVEIVEGQTYVKVDFSCKTLHRLHANQDWMTGLAKFARSIDPNKAEWTEVDLYSTVEQARDALHYSIDYQYKKDIIAIDKQVSRMKLRLSKGGLS